MTAPGELPAYTLPPGSGGWPAPPTRWPPAPPAPIRWVAAPPARWIPPPAPPRPRRDHTAVVAVVTVVVTLLVLPVFIAFAPVILPGAIGALIIITVARPKYGRRRRKRSGR